MAISITSKTRLADHREASVSLGCKACFHEREISVRALAQLIGWETRIVSAIPRLRCSKCGAHKAHVFIFYRRRPRGWTANPS